MSLFSLPIRLAQNKIVRYPGGRELDRFRGVTPAADDGRPEAWVGSTVAVLNAGIGNVDINEGRAGCILPDGREMLLRDAILLDAGGALGAEHIRLYGTEPAVLLKLLDAQNQLGLQCHPSAEYAMQHWGSKYGKAECWYILSLRDDTAQPPYVLLGFKEGVTREKFAALYELGDIRGMEALLHKIAVQPGEMYWVGPGVPHAVGAGVFCIETQEPSDITVTYRKLSAYNPDATPEQEAAYRERLLGAYAYDGCAYEENLRRRRVEPVSLSRSADGLSSEQLLIGAAQTPCFALTRVEAGGSPFMPGATGRCAILIVTEGEGRLACEAGTIPVKKGDEVFAGAAVKHLAYVPENGRLCVIAAHPPGVKW